VLRIVRELGQKVPALLVSFAGAHEHYARSSGRNLALGLDKIRAHSRHRSITTLMLYVDDHDQRRTRATLADLVAGTVID
jgi:hypothetical protein